MLDGPATFALASTPAALAPASSAARSGSCSPSANAGQQVVTSTSVGWVPGQAASTSAVAVRSMSAAAWASSAGGRRTSTLNVHRSGTVESPWPPLIAVTVSLAGNGKPGPQLVAAGELGGDIPVIQAQLAHLLPQLLLFLPQAGLGVRHRRGLRIGRAGGRASRSGSSVTTCPRPMTGIAACPAAGLGRRRLGCGWRRRSTAVAGGGRQLPPAGAH